MFITSFMVLFNTVNKNIQNKIENDCSNEYKILSTRFLDYGIEERISGIPYL
jgi:hypothetical protein